MQPLTHSELTFIVQRAMILRRIGHIDICQRGHISPGAFQKCLAGFIRYTPRMLAGLGIALESDFGLLTARYFFWCYQQETLYAADATLDQEAKFESGPPRGDEFTSLVRQIVRDNPLSSTETLISEVCGLTFVPRDMAQEGISMVIRENAKGEYGL